MMTCVSALSSCSAGVKSRPRAGDTPSTRKNPGDDPETLTRIGSPAPVIVAGALPKLVVLWNECCDLA